ncbi:hypothetical protein EDD18DRAFT_1344273 [Armillaria luteobubalina]|uniref:Uncharacterized protein n=1 Tax=Armillaria luteobubalina TaxID=153913 RepID=A0AA39UVX4_9AGAR|nr:hypothetical protein EDD18DRAFT_1344273 [Armillaria luteobubalina]
MDTSWEGVTEPRDSKLSLKDIFNGSLVHEFKGPDREKHFSIPLKEGEGHYIFGCRFDNFNPLTNKQAGKKISIGVMMLLKSKRSKATEDKDSNREDARGVKRDEGDSEGEDGPGAEGDDSEGGKGRVDKEAVVEEEIPEVSSALTKDVPGDVEGVYQGYEYFDEQSWKRWTKDDTRLWVECYARMKTGSAAEKLFNKSGQCWTPLLLLPYFDLSTMIIVDVMHNLFLGLLKTHFRGILGFHIQKTAESKPDISINIINVHENHKPMGSNDLKSIHKIISLLKKTPLKMLTDVATREIIKNKLQLKYKLALYYVAKGLDCLDEDISKQNQEIDDKLEAKRVEVLQEKGYPSKPKQQKTSIPGSKGA